MLDAIYVALLLVLFLVAIGLVQAIGRLGDDA